MYDININCLVFIMESGCVYPAVRTGRLNVVSFSARSSPV